MRHVRLLATTAVVIAAALAGCARSSNTALSPGRADAPRVVPFGETHAGATVALAKIDGRSVAIVADEDDANLHAIDLTTQRELSTTPLGGTPSQLLIGKDGRVFVTLRDRAEVAILEIVQRDGAARKVGTIATASEPVGLAMTPDDATLLVTSGWGHELAGYSVRGQTARLAFRAALPREPRSVVTSSDGKRAFVAHVVGSKLSVVDLAGAAHAVRVVDLDERHELAADAEKPEGGEEAPRKRTACQGFALAKSTDPGGRILAPQVLVDSGDTAQQASGYGSDSEPTEIGSVAVLDEADGKPIAASLSTVRAAARAQVSSASGTPAPADCLLPRAAATSSASRSLYVACFGIDSIVEYDAASADPHSGERRRWKVASGPTGIAIDADEKRAVVWSQFDRALSVLSLAEPTVGMPVSTEPLAYVPLSRKATAGARADVALGRKLFHAAGDERISSDGRACASCHPDGREDALTWATPTGPRQTPMLAGRVADTGPFGWDGDGKDIKHHLTHTFERLKGKGLSRNEVAGLTAYISTMRAPTVARSTDPLAARGREIFLSAEAACATCHSSGDKTTDGQMHAVGAQNPADTKGEFNTPSLRFVSGTAPYFHDGRYATLRELLVATDGKMGHTKQLGPAEVDALEAYLRTL